MGPARAVCSSGTLLLSVGSGQGLGPELGSESYLVQGLLGHCSQGSLSCRHFLTQLWGLPPPRLFSAPAGPRRGGHRLLLNGASPGSSRCNPKRCCQGRLGKSPAQDPGERASGETVLAQSLTQEKAAPPSVMLAHLQSTQWPHKRQGNTGSCCSFPQLIAMQARDTASVLCGRTCAEASGWAAGSPLAPQHWGTRASSSTAFFPSPTPELSAAPCWAFSRLRAVRTSCNLRSARQRRCSRSSLLLEGGPVSQSAERGAFPTQNKRFWPWRPRHRGSRHRREGPSMSRLLWSTAPPKGAWGGHDRDLQNYAWEGWSG